MLEQTEWNKLRLLQGNNSQTAVKTYREAFSQGLRQPDFLYEYALKLRYANKIDESIEILNIGMQRSGDPAFLNTMAKNLMDKGMYEEAEHCLLKSITRVPNRHYPHYLLALLYNHEEYFNYESFVEHSRWVLDTPPKIQSKSIEKMRLHLKSIIDDSEYNQEITQIQNTLCHN